MEEIIIRPIYLEQLKRYKNKPIVKVLTGQRRVGKSFLFKQFIEQISHNEPNANIIYINKEDIRFETIRTGLDLHNYVSENSIINALNYVFIDEIQEIAEFEKGIRSLLLDTKYDIYCTGSNANMLSGELATFLSGRYIEIPVYALSYLEFLQFHHLDNSQQSLQLYLKYGGMPFLKHLELTDELVYDYLKGVYNTIIYRDVIKRNDIRNNNFLENLIIFLADNIGQLFSARRISDYLKSQQSSVAVSQIINYLHHLSESYFIHPVKRMDVAGKKVFEIGEKYYFEDLGLRNTIYEYKQSDISKLMENVVYNHLKYCGFDVKVGYVGQNEIDFVTRKNGETTYIQVCYLLVEQITIDREFGNLAKIKDNYPKLVVSMDDFSGNTFQGIQHINLREFLSIFQ